MEGVRVWTKAEVRAKAKIARITAKASERANIEAKVRSRERADAAKRKT